MQLTPTHRPPNSTRKGDLVLQPLLITGPSYSLHPNTHLQDSTSSYSPILLKIPDDGATSSPISTTTQYRLWLHKCGLPSLTARLPDPRYLPFILRGDGAVMCNRWSSVHKWNYSLLLCLWRWVSWGGMAGGEYELVCSLADVLGAGSNEGVEAWHHWFLPWIPGMLSWEVRLFFCCSLVMTPIEICGDHDGPAISSCMHLSSYVCMYVCMYVCGPWCGHFMSSNSTTTFGIGYNRSDWQSSHLASNQESCILPLQVNNQSWSWDANWKST
jgi:hypothetical protein